MPLLKFYFSANSPTIPAQTCNDLFPAALKNLQVLDKEALGKPQILDTEAIRGYVVTDPVVLSAMEKFPSYQDWFLQQPQKCHLEVKIPDNASLN